MISNQSEISKDSLILKDYQLLTRRYFDVKKWRKEAFRIRGDLIGTVEAITNLAGVETQAIREKYPYIWAPPPEKQHLVTRERIEAKKGTICSSISDLLRSVLLDLGISTKLLLVENGMHHVVQATLITTPQESFNIVIDTNYVDDNNPQATKFGSNIGETHNWRPMPDFSKVFLLPEPFYGPFILDFGNEKVHSRQLEGEIILHPIDSYSSQLYFFAQEEFFRGNYLKSINLYKKLILGLPKYHPLRVRACFKILSIERDQLKSEFNPLLQDLLYSLLLEGLDEQYYPDNLNSGWETFNQVREKIKANFGILANKNLPRMRAEILK